MTLSLPQEWVVMSSQIMHKQWSNIQYSLIQYTRHLCFEFQKLCTFYRLPELHHVKASHPFPGDNPLEHGRAVQRNTGPSKNGHMKLNHLHTHWAIHSFQSFGHCCVVVQPPLSSISCQKTPSHYPSNLTSFYQIPDLHLLLS